MIMNCPDGYRESIEKGLQFVRKYNIRTVPQTQFQGQRLTQLKELLDDSDAVIIGAGAGLSTSAGFSYSGERFERYFSDFSKKYGFSDMYSGGFAPFSSEEERWAFWSRNIYVNRYMLPPNPVYRELLGLIKEKDYFVITTNVDHCFQRFGFDKKRLFYTQGDYGLWQCSQPCHKKTYDNEECVRKMLFSQGFEIPGNGTLQIPKGTELKMQVSPDLVPHCPICGKAMTMNLRGNDTFVEDEGWHKASAAYAGYLNRHKNCKVVYLELGVGANTPVIIKFPFWQMTMENPNATYVCVNNGEAFCPLQIENRSICIDGDIATVLSVLEKV